MLKDYDNQLAALAWSLWTELGVRGTERYHQNCFIALEELIVLTAVIGEFDPRLRGEALDWCSRYHDLVSISRLRTILKKLGEKATASYSEFAATLNSVSSANWPILIESTLLPCKLRDKSFTPDYDKPALLGLRLRKLFGVGVRADLFAYLLTQNALNFSASDTMEVGYSKRSLMIVLEDLAESGVLNVSMARNQHRYSLENPKQLQVLVGHLPKVAPPWTRILEVFLSLREAIPEMQASLSIREVILRNRLQELDSILPEIILPFISGYPNFARDWDGILKTVEAFAKGNFMGFYQVFNSFDSIIVGLYTELNRVDDCVDGINMILDKSQNHRERYKDFYQLFISFINDLRQDLGVFLKFPIYQLMDESLTTSAFTYFVYHFDTFLCITDAIVTFDQITAYQAVLTQYGMFTPIFDNLRQFLYSFRRRLEEVYFNQADTRSATFHKRQLVLALCVDRASEI